MAFTNVRVWLSAAVQACIWGHPLGAPYCWATNIRINHLLLEHCAAGGQAELDIILGDVVLVIDKDPAHADLGNKAIRRLLEHAALVAEGGDTIDSLNR